MIVSYITQVKKDLLTSSICWSASLSADQALMNHTEWTPSDSQFYLNFGAGNFHNQFFTSDEASNLTTGDGSSVYSEKHSWVSWKFLWAHQEISDVQQEMSDVSRRSIYWKLDVPRRKRWAVQLQDVNQSGATPAPPDGCSTHPPC